jgi:hypothetical protein
MHQKIIAVVEPNVGSKPCSFAIQCGLQPGSFLMRCTIEPEFPNPERQQAQPQEPSARDGKARQIYYGEIAAIGSEALHNRDLRLPYLPEFSSQQRPLFCDCRRRRMAASLAEMVTRPESAFRISHPLEGWHQPLGVPVS